MPQSAKKNPAPKTGKKQKKQTPAAPKQVPPAAKQTPSKPKTK